MENMHKCDKFFEILYQFSASSVPRPIYLKNASGCYLNIPVLNSLNRNCVDFSGVLPKLNTKTLKQSLGLRRYLQHTSGSQSGNWDPIKGGCDFVP